MKTKEEILSVFNSSEGAWIAYKEGLMEGYNESFHSLRNQAAIAAMQGLMNDFNPVACYENIGIIAKGAVRQADALIEELRKKGE